ncbi:MAG: arylsulfotransferase family protein [Actinomycetota bacterium]|nr:arylsulfotransferase family protein [Actinomycetota bacterium]MDD5668215.1 arylsulfotransferase family protein [Actinomycetota bacterium]
MRLAKILSMLLTLVLIAVVALVCIPLSGCLNYYDPVKCCNGYTLISNDNAAKLLDMNGNTVKTWTLNSFPAKMFPGGSLMGQGGFGVARLELSEIVQLNWEGEVEWKFTDWEEVDGVMSARVHHDFQRDGNPVGYYAPGQEPQARGGKVLVLGRMDTVDPEISAQPLLDDIVYQVDWETRETGLLWKSSEHYDEFGFDEEARNIIYNSGGDYLHVNSVSRVGPNRWYDPATKAGDPRFHPDNLIMDSRASNIIWIVNMVEGNGYEVGEIVWKVGPDYGAGTPEGDKLGQIIGQHHAHMIPAGLPGEGNILVFDNGGAAGYPLLFRWTSRILEFDPVTLDLVWKYEDPNFFSFYISSAQRLPNGNTLIDEGSVGRVFEVDPAGETVWEYVDGTGIQGFGRLYRAYRIPPEWVPGNPAGYAPWRELYEEPGTG